MLNCHGKCRLHSGWYRTGDRAVAEQLLPLLYEELRSRSQVRFFTAEAGAMRWLSVESPLDARVLHRVGDRRASANYD